MPLPKPKSLKALAEDCNPATAQVELNINNVRTRLLSGGDMWWDLDDAKYEIPKVDPASGEIAKHSLFAGALWIGGIDALGQLKVAAQTYRQTGNDFFPGPLDASGQIEQSVCTNFDQFFVVTGADIDRYLTKLEQSSGTLPVSDIPESILKWPGKDNPYFDNFALPIGKDLAPYWESGLTPGYDPTTGDYPVIDEAVEGVYADQMIWWVFNDVGNVHSETGGQQIGLEINALAFAYATNDEVNNMTFYKYFIDNKSTADIDSVFLGQWVDADLGNYQDDFVGCVVDESLGIIYNGDSNDEGTAGYGEDPPLLGVDFFKGPKDENGNQLGMSAFVYYNNDFSPTGNPETADHFYGYMAGVWKDKSPFTYGGNAYQSGGDPTNYMFPSDPSDCSPNAWSECNKLGNCDANNPADRRFLQVSGPFKLKPGAVNDVIIGVVWVQDGVQYPCPSFDPLVRADKKAQALFDNNFKLKDGPDAPNMTIRELDQELIISLWNSPNSNNFHEQYAERDPVLAGQGFKDSLYFFQGYRIFQTKTPVISPADYNNVDLAREIFTVDIEKDEITRIVNWIPNAELGYLVPVKMVEGKDEGVRHTFRITEDQFATGDKRLVNNKRYYFTVVAYGYNSHESYDPNAPSPNAQLLPYIEGRKNISVYTAIPHIVSPQEGGLVLGSEYGDGPEITQIEGVGNGGFEMDLNAASVETILANGSMDDPVYEGGAGPFEVNIFDPMLVPDDRFRLELTNDSPFQIVDAPAFGQAFISPDGILNYSPPASNTSGYLGIEHLLYRISDANGNDDIGVATFSLNDPLILGILACPVSVEHTINPNANPPLSKTIDLANSVYTGLGDWDILGIIQPRDGNASFNENKQVIYTPLFGRTNAIDEMKYIVKVDGQEFIDTASIYIYVKDDTYQPEARDDMYEITGNTSVNVLSNDQVYEIYDSGTAPVSNYNLPYILKSSTWKLTSLSTGLVYYADNNISVSNEQGIGGWQFEEGCLDNPDINFYCYRESKPLGFTINMRQVKYPYLNNNMLSSEVIYSDPQHPWLAFIEDQDGGNVAENWILSGSYSGGEGSIYDDYVKTDRDQNYEKVVNGGMAPFCLAMNAPSIDPQVDFNLPMSPGCSDCDYEGDTPTNTINELQSIDLVITPNRDLWTPCLVIEQGRFEANNGGGAKKGNLRISPSKDKDGNPIAGSTGRSYFPGYAIDIETGRRLNIMFGENSFLAGENGADMLFNPTQVVATEAVGFPTVGSYRMGGEHWIYIMASTYDGGAAAADLLSSGVIADKRQVYDNCMWVGTPILGEQFTKAIYKSPADGLVPSEVKIRVRIARPYEETLLDNPLVYEFDMHKFVPHFNDAEAASSALDLIRVVPNPYYAYSEYENDKFDNTVKITNLPDYANVKIFTLDGTLIRTLAIDNRTNNKGTSLVDKNGSIQNSLNWDLKNNASVPVASGIYIIHIEAPDLGEERVLKWFGVMRPIDLETF